MRQSMLANVVWGMRLKSAGVRLAVALLVAVFSYPAVNHAGGAPKEKPTKLDKVLRKAADAGDKSAQRVIVRTRKGYTSAVADRLKKHGDRVESEHRRLNSFTATVHGEDLRALEGDPDIEGLSVDAIIAAGEGSPDDGQASAAVDGLLTEALGLTGTKYEGEKVSIAVIDSGLEKSPDLDGGRSDRFFDFTADGQKGHPYDDYGHGTHVATLIGGEGKDSERDVEVLENGKIHKIKITPYRGVAPKARIISLKVLDADGAGYTSSVLRAIEFAIESRDELNIGVINLSLGHPIYESPDTDPLVRRGRRHPRRHHRRGGRWQLRNEPGNRRGRVRGHHVAR